MAKAGRGSEQVMIRLPDGTRDQIKEKAEANGRSMNAEIVAAIEAWLAAPDLGAAQLRELLDQERETSARLEALYENTFDIAMNYRELLRSTKSQMLHFVSMLKSLSTLVIHSDGPPNHDLIEVAGRLGASAADLKESLSLDLKVDAGRDEDDDLQGLVKRANLFLKKSREF